MELKSDKVKIYSRKPRENNLNNITELINKKFNLNI